MSPASTSHMRVHDICLIHQARRWIHLRNGYVLPIPCVVNTKTVCTYLPFLRVELFWRNIIYSYFHQPSVDLPRLLWGKLFNSILTVYFLVVDASVMQLDVLFMFDFCFSAFLCMSDILTTIISTTHKWDIKQKSSKTGCRRTVDTLQWRHNGRDSVSNHQPHDCLLNRLFRRRSKKTSKLRVTGLCDGNSPGTGEFPAQRASHAENVSIWWRHHD